MNNTTIPILDIRRLRMGTDGHGIRTLIGTTGCPLRCKYCLNPHSWNGSCEPQWYTPAQLYETVSVDNLYFRATNGGITLGGGEPLLHIDAISEFLALCPTEWNMWVETSLNVPLHNVLTASTLFHHFLVDIKTTDSEIYHAYTGGDFERAWNNLIALQQLVGEERITVRLPLIPNFVDESTRDKSFARLTNMGFTNIDLLRYSTP